MEASHALGDKKVLAARFFSGRYCCTQNGTVEPGRKKSPFRLFESRAPTP